MTTNELTSKLNESFGLDQWPETYEVDAITYGHLCNHLIRQAKKLNIGGIIWADVAVGKKNGIMFKNVELILKAGDK